jgi:hypothetical protein
MLLNLGLVAEEVAEVDSKLVVHDKSGEIYTVRYDAVNAMLLNEFRKEHRKVQEQEATIAQKDLKATAARQQTQIQELATARRSEGGPELSKAAAQTGLTTSQ